MAQTLPFSGTASTAANVPVWNIRQSGAGRAGQFEVINSANNNPALLGIHSGSGVGVFGRTQSGRFAIWGQHLTSGTGVYGSSITGIGVHGTSDRSYGVFGQNFSATRTGQRSGVVGVGNAEDGGRFISARGNGVFASGGNIGGMFQGAEVGISVEGGEIGGIFTGSELCAEFTGPSQGIFVSTPADAVSAVTSVSGSSSVSGLHTGPQTGFGVRGTAEHGVGVQGTNQSTDASAFGVVGLVASTNPGPLSAGVRGINNGTGGAGIGVHGSHNGSGWGVWGHANGAGIGVRGSVGDVTNGFAGFFAGNVQIAGTLTKSSGAFKIDHPLDPQNKYLYHSFVESPDMKNVYDGIIVLDGNGEAVVYLPEYFEALNKDFRYQLTCIGDFAPVFIAQEIYNNSFMIGGGKPGMKVSWQVTGIRKDAYAIANPITVEQDKPDAEKGTYTHPEAYGLPRAPLTQ